MEQDALVGAILLPVAVATLLLGAVRLFRWRWAWCGSETWCAVAGVLVIGAAFAQQVSGGFSYGAFPWQPHTRFDWLPWGLALTVLITAVGKCGRIEALIAGVGAGAVFVLVAPAGQPGWVRAVGAVIAVVAAVLVMIAPRSVPREGAPRDGSPRDPSAFLSMWGSAAALSMLVLHAGFARLAVVLGAFSAFMAAVALLRRVQPPLHAGPAAVALWCAAMAAGAVCGMASGSDKIPAIVWWSMAASPGAGAVAAIPCIARRPRMAQVVRVAAPVALAALGLGVGVACSR